MERMREMPGWLVVVSAALGFVFPFGVLMLVRRGHKRYVDRTYFDTLFVPEDEDPPSGTHRRLD